MTSHGPHGPYGLSVKTAYGPGHATKKSSTRNHSNSDLALELQGLHGPFDLGSVVYCLFTVKTGREHQQSYYSLIVATPYCTLKARHLM